MLTSIVDDYLLADILIKRGIANMTAFIKTYIKTDTNVIHNIITVLIQKKPQQRNTTE